MQSIFLCLFCGLFLSFLERFDGFRVWDKKKESNKSGGFRPKIGFFARFIATNAAVFGVQK